MTSQSVRLARAFANTGNRSILVRTRDALATVILLSFLLQPLKTCAQATAYPAAPPLLVGAAWYPEQWPEAQWDKDLTLMEAAHIHLVRVGEFAWSNFEPSDNRFDFAWMDRAVQQAAAHHIVVVMCTPTAAPPAWLTTRYPETLRVNETGRRDEHGNRQQFSFANPHYRELAHRIAEQLAVRYGHNPDVVGWQIDNELAADSFDPDAKSQFHDWLRKKYSTTANLNDKWTTAYWSQTYDDFNEVPVRAQGENPGLLLDWRHFATETWHSYVKNQVDAIRPHADPRQFITTNTMGWFDNFDEYSLHDILDIAAWDDYVGGPVYDYVANGAVHDLTRGYKRRNFWVMETEPAFVNWRANNNPLRKGQVREMAWQAIGHGADAVEYWQWRSALNGQEQYHGVLAGADGTPVPVYDEVRQIGAEFDKAGPALAGTSPHSDVAVIQSYDSRWAIDFQRHNREFDPIAEMLAFYRPLVQQAQSIDILSPYAPLDQYKLVVAPALNVLPQALADRLIAYVQGGGNLVLGPRSGMKDEFNRLNVQRQPGPLVDLLGGRAEQFYSLDTAVPVSGDAGSGTASLWAEQLSTRAPDTKVLLRYGASNGWLDDQPAAITRRAGKGSITYIGAWLDQPLLDKMMGDMLHESGVQPVVPDTPAGVEVLRRAKGSAGASSTAGSILILINHNEAAATVSLPSGATDLLTEKKAASSIELPPHGVAVLQSSK
ncbi:MAG TPA: beta-galactosidase [Acidisarcina sp.]